VDPPGSEEEDESSRDFEPSPGHFKSGESSGRGRARSVVGRNLMQDHRSSFDLRRKLRSPSPMDEEFGGESSGWASGEQRPEWVSRIMAEVKDLVGARDSGITSKDIDNVRAAQRQMDLQTEAARLNSEGARAQFVAFGKVKAGVSDAIRSLRAHKTLNAIKVLEEVEKVADLRINVVRRAGSTPGAQAAATIYERKLLAESSDAKNDKLWDAPMAEAGANKAKVKVTTGQNRRSSEDYGGPPPHFCNYGRGQPRPFRGQA
jgi:hypothetical protein